MATRTMRASSPEIGDVLEVSVSGDGSGGVLRTEFEVQKDSSALALTITDGGEHLRGATDARVVVRDPKGREVLSTLISEPEPGVWTIDVEYGPTASVEVGASVLKRGWRERLGKSARWFRCKTCKMLLKTFVVALLLQLGPIVAAGTAAQGTAALLAALGDATVEAIKQTFSLSVGELPRFLSIFTDYIDNPIDTLLERVCGWLRLCGAVAVASSSA